MHGDIDQSSVVLGANGTVRLGNIGMSESSKRVKLSTGLDEKRARYQSPQILQRVDSAKTYDPYKADVWALGVTIY